MTEAVVHYDAAVNGADYTSTSQQRLLSVLEYLAATPFTAFRVDEIAKELGESRNAVFRDLKNLELAGFAENHGSAWRVSPKITRFSEAVRLTLADLHQKYLEAGKNG